MGLVTQYPVDPENPAFRDAFGRWRTSDPVTLFESKQIADTAPSVWDDQEESGSGTSSTYTEANARTRIAVGATTAGLRTRQTFRRINYIPGKSQLCLFTGIINASGGGTGITQSIGLFDDDNGLFFRNNEGTMEVVVRNSTVDTAVAQSAWDDPMDGTGPSGLTVDWTKTHIFVVDFEWLGVGTVRFGLNIDGVTYIVHQVHHANNETAVYMANPNLPVRYQIENDGTGAASALDHICCTIQSEGGAETVGEIHYVSNGSTGINGASVGTLYALLGIRLKTTTLNISVELLGVQTITSSNKEYEWQLILNPTVGGTFTYADANYQVQTAIGVATNTVTGGVVLAGGYGTTEAGASLSIDQSTRLGAAIDNTRDEIVLCFRPLQTNTVVFGGLTYKELM